MKKVLIKIAAFVLPVSLWLFLFRAMLSGRAGFPSQETLHIYAVVKFYFNSLMAGTFPLWNPYVCWGMPIAVYLNYICIFNPIWFLMLFLNIVGVSMYNAFLLTITAYLFLGVLGFYLLARRVFQDERTAYAAGLVFLFSSASLSTFVQYHPVLIFVPGIWFLYFAVSLAQTWDKKYFLGLVYAGMLVMTSYLPLYFLTVVFIFLAFFIPLYPRAAKGFLAGLGRFSARNKMLTLVCLLGLGAAGWSSVQAYQQTVEQEIVAPFRQNQANVFDRGVEFTNYELTTDGGLSARMTWAELFVRLGDIEYKNEGFLYISLPVFLILILSSGRSLTRKTVLFGGAAAVLFLLIINDAAPLHRFLYEHVGYFKLLRNYYFLNPFLVVLVVFLTAEQLRSFLMRDLSSGPPVRKRIRLGLVCLAHAGAVLFLFHFHETIILSSYAALGLSAVYWGRRVLYPGRRRAWYGLLVLSLLVQPVEVFWRYNAKADEYGQNIREAGKIRQKRMTFAFTRPDKIDAVVTRDNEQIFTLAFWISLQDSPGYFMEGQSGFPSYWSYYLVSHLPELKKAPLFRHKFILYDQVQVADIDEIMASREFPEAVLRQENRAFVSESGRSKADLEKELSGLLTAFRHGRVSGQPTLVMGNTKGFQLKLFSANKVVVQTDLPQEKFLVYTDSYSKGWQAFLNGRKTAVIQTDVAFKGVRIPPGKNELVLRYRPLSKEILYFTTAVLFLLFGGGVITVFVLDYFRDAKRRGRPWVNGPAPGVITT